MSSPSTPFGKTIKRILVKHEKVVFGSWIAYALTSKIHNLPDEQQKPIEEAYFAGATTLVALMMEQADRNKTAPKEERDEDTATFNAVISELTKFAMNQMLAKVKPEGEA
jgi:hypothetical protein